MQATTQLRPLSEAEIAAVNGGVLLLYWLLVRPAY